MAKRGFGSDNFSGVLPEIMEALNSANQEHELAYGDDVFTKKLELEFQKLFDTELDVFLCFNGTGANALGITCMVDSYHSVISASSSHIYVDECGAIEKSANCRISTIETSNGKITVDQIKPMMHVVGSHHHSQPKVISISQCTELGTVYTAQEIKTLCDFAHQNSMYVHVDGARIANAVKTKEELRAMIVDSGVDMLSFGGTKNGLMFGEAALFFNKDLAEKALFYRKQLNQLSSKMRFISCQFLALLKDDLWIKTAQHSNKMAKMLEEKISHLDKIQITQNVESNGIWAIIPKESIKKLQKEYFFWVWDEEKSEVRWLCSFDTKEEDIINFANLLQKELA
ncbi:MAG: beta-eliminating lyase-related protein [Marinifilaceae bacterium]|jgi:threonine aldolase|nr:beta-eliminating lyase-related protein [Marinifilaceae bacterium]